MRVLHLIDNLNQGGEQRQLLELCRRTDQGTIKHLLLTYHWDPFFLDDFKAAGVDVGHISKGLGFSPSFLVRLLDYVRRRRVDILHGHMFGPSLWSCLAAALRPSTGLVLQEASVDYDVGIGKALLKASLYRRADEIITNTCLQSEILASRYRIRSTPITVVPNGVDLERYPAVTPAGRAAARERLGLSPDSLQVGLSGRVYDLKDPWLLLEAVLHIKASGGRVPEVLHAGLTLDRDLRDRIDGAARDAGIRWRWLGEVSDMAGFYAALDVLALTSTREGLPNVLLEAMATAVPVVATDVGDVPRLLADGGGTLIGAGDKRAASGALAALLAMTPQERAAIGRRGRDIAGGYSPEANLSAMMEVYQRVFARSGLEA